MIPPRPPFFRALKVNAFHVVTSLMGEAAVWETLPLETVGVGLFKTPTGKDELGGATRNVQAAEYNSELPEFHYVVGQFPGLFEAVRAGAVATLRLSDGRRFLIGDVARKFDGETFAMLLEPITF